jgi:hypothetical protein
MTSHLALPLSTQIKLTECQFADKTSACLSSKPLGQTSCVIAYQTWTTVNHIHALTLSDPSAELCGTVIVEVRSPDRLNTDQAIQIETRNGKSFAQGSI